MSKEAMAELKKLKTMFKKATPTKEGVRVRPPEGEHQARLEAVELTMSKGGNPMLILDFSGVSRELKEHSNNHGYMRKFSVLTERNVPYVKNDAKTLTGKTTDDIMKLPDLVASAVGVVLNIRVAHQDDGENVNIYLDELVKDKAKKGKKVKKVKQEPEPEEEIEEEEEEIEEEIEEEEEEEEEELTDKDEFFDEDDKK